MRLPTIARTLAVAGLTAAGVALFPAHATTHAAGAPSIPVLLRPSDAQGNVVGGSGYYQVVASPGQVVQLYAFVGNKGRVNAGIDLVPVDATTGEYGAVSYDLPQQPRKHVGAWIHLARRWVTLNSNQGIVVPFSLHIPRHLAPGQYVGGLSAYVPATVKHVSHGVGLTVQTRVLDAVVVTVRGRTHARFGVRGVSATYRSKQVYVLIHLHNSGNVLLKGYGYLWVYAPHATKPWIHRAFFVDTTVPHTGDFYPIHWAARVPAGEYRYSVYLRWGAGAYRDETGGNVMQWSGGRTVRRGFFSAP